MTMNYQTETDKTREPSPFPLEKVLFTCLYLKSPIFLLGRNWECGLPRVPADDDHEVPDRERRGRDQGGVPGLRRGELVRFY